MKHPYREDRTEPVSQVPNCITSPNEANRSPSAVVHQSGAPLRILVVDEKPAVREFLVAGLTHDGHSVAVAKDGLEGLQKFEGGEFDVVLTDRAMPQINGDQLAASVKAVSPQMPVILLTGFGDIMDPVSDRPVGLI